jgi:gamma-glutamylcyclotransferase (GGCT)/AIG2-like uncharacterized protein YtfP
MMSSTSIDEAIEQLPLFAYGTLRPTQKAYNTLLKPFAKQTLPAYLPGYEMYASAYPYIFATDQPQKVVIGDLIFIDPLHFINTLTRLDSYEGYQPSSANNQYSRLILNVFITSQQYPHPTMRAWGYVGNNMATKQQLTLIESGDWLTI